MGALKYKVIKSREQYDRYCKILQQIIKPEDQGGDVEDEIELLTLLIEKWDEEHAEYSDIDPIALLKYLMDENNLKAKDLADILNISKSHVSEILNYKKRLSKDVAGKLATRFCVSQEAFTKPYELATVIRTSTEHTKAA